MPFSPYRASSVCGETDDQSSVSPRAVTVLLRVHIPGDMRAVCRRIISYVAVVNKVVNKVAYLTLSLPAKEMLVPSSLFTACEEAGH